MRRTRRIAALAGTALLASLMAVVTTEPGGAAPPTATATTTTPLATTSETKRFPVYDASGRKIRDALWRLTDAGGNCCENYVTATANGWLLDFGGHLPVVSADRGVTWHQVTPPTSVINGEGSIAAAPNGDVVGVGWTGSAGGDRLTTFKYDATTKTWAYHEIQPHHPYFDRPWLATVPGPFVLPDGTKAPYASVLRANYLSALYDVFYVSFDGLTYLPSTDEAVQATGPLVTGYLEPAAMADMDYLQPHPSMNVTPLPRGGFLNVVASRGQASCPATRYGVDLTWTCFTLPSRALVPGLRVDSRGWLHQVVEVSASTFRYEQSADGGRTWEELILRLPEGGAVIDNRMLDYKVNGALGVAAVTVHVDTDRGSQDVVFRVDTSSRTPRHVESMVVGAGDLNTGAGLTELGPRFDFSTLAMLPDGTVAVSFQDASTEDPRLAIEIPEEWTPPAETTSPEVTVAPTTAAPTTPAPTTPAPTTLAPTTAPPTTAAATVEPTTAAPTTAVPTTPVPTTQVPTTPPPPSDTRAPAASAVLPARITDPVSVLFDEPVTGTAHAALRLANGTHVATTARCWNGATATSCAQPVTEVELRPATALRPGERYVVEVAPPGTAPPRDAAGNAVIPARFGFRASTVEEQGTPAARWSWRAVPHSSAVGGSFHTERRAGATATYAFRGTSVTWVGAAGPSQGVVDVYVDGVRRATVDTYAPSWRWRVTRSVGGLADRAHVLTLRVRGGRDVVVDDVPGATRLGMAWATAPSRSFSGGSAAVADGGEVTFAFRGTGVTWATVAGPEMGRAAVFVDGRLWGTHDNYAASRRYDVRRAFTGLPDGVHTVTVRALGTRSARATGTAVVVDRWLVR